MNKEPTIWQTTEALSAIVRLLTIHGAMTGTVLRKFAHELGGISNGVVSSALASGIKRAILTRTDTPDGSVYSVAPDETLPASRQGEPQQPVPPPAPTSSAAAIYEVRCSCGSRFRTATLGVFQCERCRAGQPVTIPASVTTSPPPTNAQAPIRRRCSCGQWFDVKNALDEQCPGCVELVRKFREEQERLARMGIGAGRLSTGYAGPR